jgi:hypothetical protein
LQGENGGQLQDFDGIVEAREVKYVFKARTKKKKPNVMKETTC